MWKQTCHEWQCQQSRAIFYQQCACALNILSHCECFHVTCFMGSWRTQSIVFWSFLIHSILLSFSLLDTLVTYDLTNQLSIIKLWMHYVFHQFVFRVNDCVDGFNCGGFSCVRIDTWFFLFLNNLLLSSTMFQSQNVLEDIRCIGSFSADLWHRECQQNDSDAIASGVLQTNTQQCQ